MFLLLMVEFERVSLYDSRFKMPCGKAVTAGTVRSGGLHTLKMTGETSCVAARHVFEKAWLRHECIGGRISQWLFGCWRSS
jgi:hypothetical protein